MHSRMLKRGSTAFLCCGSNAVTQFLDKKSAIRSLQKSDNGNRHYISGNFTVSTEGLQNIYL